MQYNIIPSEVWGHILTFCTAKELINARRVCHMFEQIVQLGEKERYLELIHPVVTAVIFDEVPETGEVRKLIKEELSCSEIKIERNEAYEFIIYEREIFFENKGMHLRRVRLQIHCFHVHKNCELPCTILWKNYDWFIGVWSKVCRNQFLSKMEVSINKPIVDSARTLILDLQQKGKTFTEPTYIPAVLHYFWQRCPCERYGYCFRSELAENKNASYLFTSNDLLNTLLSALPFPNWNKPTTNKPNIPANVPGSDQSQVKIICGNCYDFIKLLEDPRFNFKLFSNQSDIYLTNMFLCDTVAITNPLYLFQRVGWYSMKPETRLKMVQRYFDECVFKKYQQGSLEDLYCYEIRPTYFYIKDIDKHSNIFKKVRYFTPQEPFYSLVENGNAIVRFYTAVTEAHKVIFKRITIEMCPELSASGGWIGLPRCSIQVVSCIYE